MKKIVIFLIFIQFLYSNSLKEKCNNEDMQSCALLGKKYYYSGKYSKALNIFKKLCNSKNAPACGIIGIIYEEGKGVDIDLNKSIYYYQKGCNLNSMKSCDNLSNAYRKKGMYKKAFNIDKKNCNKKKSKGNCYNTALYYLEGKYVENNVTLAEKYFNLSCKYGYKKGCKR